MNDRDCPLPASLQLSSQSDAACQVVYKTAALPAELHRRRTLSMGFEYQGLVADRLGGASEVSTSVSSRHQACR
jgi:hypothetical protein